MSVQTNRLRRRSRAAIPLFALMTVTPLLSCSEDGDPISDVDEFARFDARMILHNALALYWNGDQYSRGGSVHLTIPEAGEQPPCCLVSEGLRRAIDIRVLPHEAWFIRVYHVQPGTPLNVNQFGQTRCRVTATGPTTGGPRPQLIVTYDALATDQLLCSGGWENF